MTPVRTSAKEHRAHGTEKDWRPHVRIAQGKEGGTVSRTHTGEMAEERSGDTAPKSHRSPSMSSFHAVVGTGALLAGAVNELI